MSALKSHCPIEAAINMNFILKVQEPGQKNWSLTTARKCIDFIQDEDLKIRMFEKAMTGKQNHYLFKIRNRLKIKFHGK